MTRTWFVTILVASALLGHHHHHRVYGFSAATPPAPKHRQHHPRLQQAFDTIRPDEDDSIETTTTTTRYSSGCCRRAFLTRNVVAVAATGVCTIIIGTQPNVSFAAYIDPNETPPVITQRVYLDVKVPADDQTTAPQRIVIGVFGELVPRVAENFVRLCQQNKYAGTTFYRVLSDLNIQGGAIGDPTGKTGQSSYGSPFEPDNYNLKHTQTGLVSMVRGPTGEVDSRFFINCNDNGGWADDRYAAFGIVESGSLDVVKAIEKVQVQTPKNSPKQDVTIVSSGLL